MRMVREFLLMGKWKKVNLNKRPEGEYFVDAEKKIENGMPAVAETTPSVSSSSSEEHGNDWTPVLAALKRKKGMLREFEIDSYKRLS